MYNPVKRIGSNGQVSVGVALAGRLIRIESSEQGLFLRFVVDVPMADGRPLGAQPVASLAQALPLGPESDEEWEERLFQAAHNRTWPLPKRRV
jgi:hypothetical protein